MQKYEVVTILKGTLTDAEAKKIEAEVKENINKNGKILAEETWGKRRLAFKVQKLSEGYYYFYTVEADKAKVTLIKDYLRHNTEIIRFLFLKKD
jgi:small subunit ribosomal protein S6